MENVNPGILALKTFGTWRPMILLHVNLKVAFLQYCDKTVF